MTHKRARPGPSFYLKLASQSCDDNQFYPNVDQFHDNEANDPSYSNDKPSQKKKPSMWKDGVIEECVSVGVKSQGVMRIINRFILETETEACF